MATGHEDFHQLVDADIIAQSLQNIKNKDNYTSYTRETYIGTLPDSESDYVISKSFTGMIIGGYLVLTASNPVSGNTTIRIEVDGVESNLDAVAHNTLDIGFDIDSWLWKIYDDITGSYIMYKIRNNLYVNTNIMVRVTNNCGATINYAGTLNYGTVE